MTEQSEQSETKRCVACAESIYKSAKVCPKCNFLQDIQRRPPRYIWTYVVPIASMLSALTALWTLSLLPQLGNFFAPEESDVSAHIPFSHRESLFLRISNEGKKDALLKAAALSFVGRMTLWLDTSEIEIIQRDSEKFHEFTHDRITVRRDLFASKAEQEEYERFSNHWVRSRHVKVLPSGGGESSLDWARVFYLRFLTTAEYLKQHEKTLLDMDTRNFDDKRTDYGSARERVLDFIDSLDHGEIWVGAHFNKLILDKIICHFKELELLDQELTHYIRKEGVNLLLKILNSNGKEELLSVSTDYSLVYEFVLPLLMGDKSYEPSFVDYFLHRDLFDEKCTHGTQRYRNYVLKCQLVRSVR